MIVCFIIQPPLFYRVAFKRLGSCCIASYLLDEYVVFSPEYPPFRFRDDIVYLDYFGFLSSFF